MKNKLRIFAVILLIILGIGGVSGGWMLISEPDGKNFQWTVELLEGTPFRNFLIPGIVLFIMNGLLPLFIAAVTIIKIKKYAVFIVLQGCILIGWLTAEIIFSRNLFSPLMHSLFYGIAILLIVCGGVLFKTTKYE